MAKENAELVEISEEDFLSGLRPKQQWFLAGFCLSGTIVGAEKNSTVSRRNHYKWLTKDPKYRHAYFLCRKRVCDHIEASLVDRLVNGVVEPVFQNGKRIGEKVKFDNRSALRYLERVNQDVFGPRSDKEDEELYTPIDYEGIKERLLRGERVPDAEMRTAEIIQAMRDSCSPE